MGLQRHFRKVTSSRTNWHHWNEACMERKMRLRSGATRGPRHLSREESTMGKACPAMFCGTSESEGTFCAMGDDFVVPASRKRLAEFGELLTEHFEVRQTGTHWALGKKLAGAQQDLHQQRLRRHSSRTRPVPCQKDGEGTRLDRHQEREDASIEVRPRHTLADREQQDFGAVGSNSPQKLHHARWLAGSRKRWTCTKKRPGEQALGSTHVHDADTRRTV